MQYVPESVHVSTRLMVVSREAKKKQAIIREERVSYLHVVPL